MVIFFWSFLKRGPQNPKIRDVKIGVSHWFWMASYGGTPTFTETRSDSNGQTGFFLTAFAMPPGRPGTQASAVPWG